VGSAVACVTFALTLLVVGFKLSRPGAGRQSQALLYICGTGLCLSLSDLVNAPFSVRLIARLSATPNLDMLLGDSLKLIGVCLLAAFAGTLGERDRGWPARRMLTLAVVLASLVALFVAAHFISPSDDPDQLRAQPLAGAGYCAVLVGYPGWCLAGYVVLLHRTLRGSRPGSRRTGLRLFLLAAVVGLAWTAWGVDDVMDVLRDGGLSTGDDTISATLGAMTVSLAAAGVTLTAWAGHLRRPVRWYRDVRAHHKLAPLWAVLQAAQPQIALNRRRHRLGRAAAFARYRRVIEIRDAQLALRPYAPDEIAAWTRADDAATREAAVIAACLEAHTAGYRYRPSAVVPAHPVEPSLRSETEWLVGVAREFRHSVAVAAARERTRADLARRMISRPGAPAAS
jgi:hypothetical protein